MSRTAESPFSLSMESSQSLRSTDFTRGSSSLQDFAQIADQRDIHFHVLVDLGGIDFDVDLLGILARRS